jgi:hypothetical protein
MVSRHQLTGLRMNDSVEGDIKLDDKLRALICAENVQYLQIPNSVPIIMIQRDMIC